MPDNRLYSPSAARNRGPILDVLRDILPPTGLVLEIASGSGEHVIHFAAALPALLFQPSDPDPQALASIAGWVAQTRLANVEPPVQLDAAAAHWPVGAVDAVICINMVHISPWPSACGLLAGAGARLKPGSPLCLYGPFTRDGRHTAASNAEFDASLKARNPEWGVRDIADLTALANSSGFSAPVIHEMPANNFSLIFWRL